MKVQVQVNRLPVAARSHLTAQCTVGHLQVNLNHLQVQDLRLQVLKAQCLLLQRMFSIPQYRVMMDI